MADALITRRGGAGGGKPVNGVLNTFVANEKIEANSFVEFDGEDTNIETLLSSQYGFSGQSLGVFLSAAVSQNTILVFNAYNYNVKACIFKINSDGTATQGTTVAVGSSRQEYSIDVSNVLKVKDNFFVVAYSYTSTSLKVIGMEINDMTITAKELSSTISLGGENMNGLALKRMSESSIVLTYNVYASGTATCTDQWLDISSGNEITLSGSKQPSQLTYFMSQIDLNDTTVLRLSSQEYRVQVIRLLPEYKTKIEGTVVKLFSDTGSYPAIQGIASYNAEGQCMRSENGEKICLLSPSYSSGSHFILNLSVDLNSLALTLLSEVTERGYTGTGVKFKEKELIIAYSGYSGINSVPLICNLDEEGKFKLVKRKISADDFFKAPSGSNYTILPDGFAYVYGSMIAPKASTYQMCLVRFRKAVKQSNSDILGITKNGAIKDGELEVYTL